MIMDNEALDAGYPVDSSRLTAFDMSLFVLHESGKWLYSF